MSNKSRRKTYSVALCQVGATIFKLYTTDHRELSFDEVRMDGLVLVWRALSSGL
jgi:hypothetical protein